METGDIIIVLDERDHDRFQRKGSDLVYKMVRRVECWAKRRSYAAKNRLDQNSVGLGIQICLPQNTFPNCPHSLNHSAV